jgi:hypothetical protein
MSEVIVHTVPGSPFARAVMATLEEKQIPWRLWYLFQGCGNVIGFQRASARPCFTATSWEAVAALAAAASG